MRVHGLTVQECVAFLADSRLGRIACAYENQPYIVPIHFSYDASRRCLYSFSTVGQKIEWMRQNPKVCVEVDDITDKDHWITVVVFGRYEELGDAADDLEARNTAHDLFAGRREWWLPAAAKVGAQEHHQPVLYRVQIDRLTGRRASRGRLDQ